MSAQEFVLIPKENYIKKQPKASEILDEPTTVEKAKLLTILQRQPSKIKKVEDNRVLAANWNLVPGWSIFIKKKTTSQLAT